MSYRITAFGAVSLPDAMLEDDLSTARVASSLTGTLGGVVDIYGPRQRAAGKQEIEVSGLYVGEVRYLVSHAGDQLVDHAGNSLIAESGRRWLRQQVELLRGMVGRRDQLWRRRDDDGAMHWRTARLLGVEMEQDTDRWAAEVAQVKARFETAQGAWRGAAAVVNTVSLQSNVSRTETMQILGNAPVEDSVITLTATGTITSLRVRVTALGIDWTWAGSLTAGQTLTVDCGALTVRKAGADAYSGFTLNAGHTAAGWLPLAVGSNAVLLLATGPGTVTISHFDQWL